MCFPQPIWIKRLLTLDIITYRSDITKSQKLKKPHAERGRTMKRQTGPKRSKAKTRKHAPLRKKPRVRKPRLLKTADEFFSTPESMQELYLNVLNLVGQVRQGVPRRRAMQELHLTRAHVDRFAKSAFRKLKNGRYVAKAYDRLLRVVTVISEDGLREVTTLDSRQASKAGKHSAAVNRYLQTGDPSRLAQFEGKYIIDAKGERVPLLTDLEELEEMGSAGVLSFESLYARSL
jgi:hypothetical protein